MQQHDKHVLDDTGRLQALRRTCLMDSHAEAAFDRLTRLASRMLGAPISLVSLVDTDRQYFKSATGIDLKQTPLSHSFCQHVVATGQPLVIEDARTDPLVMDNLAIPDLGVIGYLGMPLHTSDGYVLGSLCIIDHEPRTWTDEEIKIMQDLSVSVMMEVELRMKVKLSEQVGRTISDTDLYGLQESSDKRRFGMYTVLRKIGSGGMADVYLCNHKALQVPLAVKQLRPRQTETEEFVNRFRQEIEIVSQLKHPNIVRLFGHGLENDGAYMVMEYIDGMTLTKLIRQRGHLSVRETLQIATELAEALDYAHQQGIVHRDIKPDNIMMRDRLRDGRRTGAYHPTLMDFGVSKVTRNRGQITQEGALGTLSYIAPEQIEDASTVDYRADIYAFGAMLFQMLTGYPPFGNDSVAALVNAHLNMPAPSPRDINPEVPQHVAAAVMRAMEKRPDSRYASAGSLVAAMEQPTALA